MRARIISRFNTELSHFNLLSVDMKHMLMSYGFYLAAYPLLATFMNAYLWRSSGSLWSIIVYNVGWIIGLPCGFYLNGLLLKKFHILRLYFAGLLLQAIIPIMIVFLPMHGLPAIYLYGLMYGAGAGLFWGNKTYLDLQITRGANRIYYNSLGTIVDMMANILVPAAIGWFIVYANSIFSSESFVAYKIVMGIGFILLFVSGFIMQSSHIKNIVITNMIVRKPTRRWNMIRMFNLVHNIQVGVTLVLANVVILVLVGGEGVLGTVQTITAGFSSLMVYLMGRKATASVAWKFVAVGSLIFFVGTSTLAGIFTWVGALAYSMVITIAWAIQWTPANSVTMDLLDAEEHNPEKQYANICDNELFYNIGRGIGISIVVMLLTIGGENTALRWSPFIVGIVQLPLGWFIYTIVKNKRLPTPTTATSTTASGGTA